ncbi:MAG: DUF4132 domain-containing protein [Propionibacteriaceae bacterium]|nr:DUF4132 domain-containing protein [Propionibacteriaceae bacterium]
MTRTQLTDPDQIGWNVTPFDLAMNLNAEVTVEDDTERFDPEQELARAKRIATLHKGASAGYEQPFLWTFSEPLFTTLPSAERATWWLTYLHDVGDQDTVSVDLPSGVSLALAVRGTSPRAVTKERHTLFSHLPKLDSLALRVVLPHLSDEGRALALEAAEQPIHSPLLEKPYPWQVKAHDKELFAAASLGQRDDDVREALAEITDGMLAVEHAPAREQALVLTAPTVDERVAVAERLGARMTEPPILLTWLIATGAAGFPLAVRSLESLERPAAEACLQMVSPAMTGVGAVPFFAEVAAGRHARIATEWLTAHLPQVLAADLSDAKAAPLALVLRAVPVEELREALPRTTGGVRKVVEQAIIELELPTLDPAVGWWAEAAASVKRAKLPAWLTPASLPPLLIDDVKLASAEVGVLLQALMSADRAQPLVAAVRERAVTRSRDEFAVGLLNLWLGQGALPKQGWMMTGAGCLGHDAFVFRLVPLIREWPGQSQHKRAVNGLDALRNVGTGMALQQISGIANKAKFAGIKKRAREAMEEIAEGLGLTRDRLEDRVIPDGGLDERGTREFSYGHRRFRANLTPEGKLVARLLDDGRPTGKVLTTLPAPLKADDPLLAKDAKAEFMLVKKTVAALAPVQVKRFEKAMMAGRRWSASEFTEFLAPNPLLRGLLGGVVWGLYPQDAAAAHISTFRLDEEGTAVDADDDPVELAGHTVGIVHPVALSPEELSLWGDVLADYELTAPFPQLDRPVYDLPDSQGDDVELKDLPRDAAQPGRLFGAFARYDWERGEVLDAGGYSLYWAQFPTANLTAVIEFSPGLLIGQMADQEPQTVKRVYLVEGVIDGKVLGYGWLDKRPPKGLTRVPWSAVPRAVVNEVLTVLAAIYPRLPDETV